MRKLCQCGCEKFAKEGNKFIHGHNTKMFSDEIKKILSEKRTGKGNGLYGKPLTKEHKRRISKSNKGRVFSRSHKQRLSKSKQGRKLSEETKIKISLSRFGKNNPNWKGGITHEPYCEIWLDNDFKKSIKERDGHECKNPFCKNICCNDLAVHHINYIKKDCHPNNLITLCRSCNGRANFNRLYWENVYKDIIKEINLNETIVG